MRGADPPCTGRHSGRSGGRVTKKRLQVAGQGPMRGVKGGRAPNESDLFRRADAEARTPDELLDIAARATPQKMGLPTTWGDRDAPVRGPDAKVIAANGEQVRSYGFGGHSVCGECKYFDVENGRAEIIKQRFAERLVREQEWQMKHLGVPADSLALCGAGGGELVVHSSEGAFQGFASAARPQRRLHKKLPAKTSCTAPSAKAA